MGYKEFKKYGFVGILPQPKNGFYTKKEKQKYYKFIENKVIENKEFCQAILNYTKKTYINEVIENIINFVFIANAGYYYYKGGNVCNL